MQVKGAPTALLIVVLGAVSVTLTLALAVHLSPGDAGQCKVCLAGTTGTVPSLKVWQNGSHTVINVTFWHGKYIAYNGWMLHGDRVEVEVDGVLDVVTICVADCARLGLITDCPHDAGAWESPHKYMHTLSYDLGEITGAQPTVRVRVRTLDCQGYGLTHNEPHFPYSDWVVLREAAVWQPPIIEAAVVIGVVSIAIGVGNNYLQGRREQKATEVTRTAAEDERFMELYNASRETAFQRTMAEVLYQYSWSDAEDFQAKYGPTVDVEAWAKVQSLAQYFEGIGVMVDEGSIEIHRVTQLLGNQVVAVWEKLQDVILGQRQRELNPSIYGAFEHLYYAIKKYQQEGPPQPEGMRVHKFE